MSADPALMPVYRVTVLYDAHCELCRRIRDWLAGQRQLVPLELVPAGSAEAHRRFPELDHAATLREITVVGDRGQVYRGARAWLVCLWTLAGYRQLAVRLSTPALEPAARLAVLVAARARALSGGRRPGSGYGDPREGTCGAWCR